MLNFFYTFNRLLRVETTDATPFSILSAEKYQGKIIPFHLIYVTSSVYLRKIKNAADDQEAKLKIMNQNQVDAVYAQPKFPKDLQEFTFTSLQERCKEEQAKEVINIVVINGIGTGYGDNYVGLGAIQRLQKLLSPSIVNVYLMNNSDLRVAKVYMRADNIFLLNNCISLKDFMKMDYFINLTGMVGFQEFNELPLLRFMAEKFLVSECSETHEIQPNLSLDTIKLQSIKHYINLSFDEEFRHRPLVYFHPKASTPIRTLPKEYADAVIRGLIAHGFNVVTAIPYGFNADEFCSVEGVSTDIDDLVHIIACCDAAISVGTVVYHLSAALDIPTILLPSVQADVDSGQEMPQVDTWVPKNSKDLIMKKHKGKSEDELSIADKIWKNIEPEILSARMLEMFNSSSK